MMDHADTPHESDATHGSLHSMIPNDFDPQTYLALHKDVADSGMNPAEHFAQYGRIEGRAYKSPEHPTREWSSNYLQKLHNLKPNLSTNYIRRCLLDETAYYDIRPDVASTNICPIYHFIKHGYKEGSIPDTLIISSARSYSSADTHLRIAHVFGGKRSNASFQYRCQFHADANAGTVALSAENSFEDTLLALFSCETASFLRPDITPRTRYLMTLCRNIGIPVGADYDDILFPEYSLSKGSVRSGVRGLDHTKRQLEKDSAALAWADYITCSTPTLKSYLDTYGLPVSLRENKLPRRLFANESEIRSKHNNETIRLIYASGTATHVRDFSVASGPLLKFVQSNINDVELTFLGTTSAMLRAFQPYCRETRQIGMLSFGDMLTELSKHDALLVPLEATEFNDAKSNIKFIEAASQGVPVIASPVEEFQRTIQHGVNGWLCSSGQDWINTLQTLKNEPAMSTRLGLRAYQTAMEEYSL